MEGYILKKCPVCKGKGTVFNGHPFALSEQGRPTGYHYPERTGGCTGEKIADSKQSYCGKCFGTGSKLVKL